MADAFATDGRAARADCVRGTCRGPRWNQLNGKARRDLLRLESSVERAQLSNPAANADASLG